VQLTSTTDPATSRRTSDGSLLARLDYPVVPGLIAFVAWLAFVLARWQTWAAGHISLFIMSGVKYSHPAQMYPRISHLNKVGHDWQNDYRLTLIAFNEHPTV